MTPRCWWRSRRTPMCQKGKHLTPTRRPQGAPAVGQRWIKSRRLEASQKFYGHTSFLKLSGGVMRGGILLNELRWCRAPRSRTQTLRGLSWESRSLTGGFSKHALRYVPAAARPMAGRFLLVLQEVMAIGNTRNQLDASSDSPFAQSISNFLNFKLPIESSTQPLSLQDILLQP